MAGTPHCLLELEGPIAVVTLNRPEAKNALSASMLVGMWDAWQAIDADPGIRVAILTGAGGAFCAGADLKAMAAGSQADPALARRFADDPELHWKALLRHHRLAKPLVAAVEGPAIAGGTEILQATDLRVAAESARFGVSEACWGIFPLGGSTVRLRRQVPYTHAAEMLLTGRHLAAREALAIGLVGHVVPDGQALAKARELAGQIAANGPLAVQAILRALRETEGLPEREALAVELAIGSPVYASEDAREGPAAFAQKRAPRFTGR